RDRPVRRHGGARRGRSWLPRDVRRRCLRDVHGGAPSHGPEGLRWLLLGGGHRHRGRAARADRGARHAVTDAYEQLRPDGTSPLLLVCEHASNAVPEEYASLGLPQAELDRHIGYDIGAAALTRALAERLDATALLGVVSRLVIDINREPWHPGFVP